MQKDLKLAKRMLVVLALVIALVAVFVLTGKYDDPTP